MRQIWTRPWYLGVAEVKPNHVCTRKCWNLLHSVIISIPPITLFNFIFFVCKYKLTRTHRELKLISIQFLQMTPQIFYAMRNEKFFSPWKNVIFIYIIVFLQAAENICREPDVADTTLRREIPAWDHNTALNPFISTSNPRYEPQAHDIDPQTFIKRRALDFLI